MRHGLAIVATTTLAGCSLLYNPNDLPPRFDAMPDAQMIVDANPVALAIASVEPAVLREGTGDGGSRREVLVLTGTNIAQTGVTVEITAAADQADVPMFTLDTDAMQIDAYGENIAIPITLPVDVGLNAGETVKLDIKVTQDDGAGTPVAVVVSGKLELVGYNEYDAAAPLAADAAGNVFSRVRLSTGTLPPPPGDGPIYIHSNSSLSLTAPVVLDGKTSATADVGGAGGPNAGDGGAGGKGGLQFGSTGTPGTGPAGGLSNGGNAAPFGGDEALATLALDRNRGSGGGGGNSGTLAARGGNGGGGGGAIALSADGNVTLGSVSAKGAPGEVAGSAGLGAPSTDGGAGSGGVIVVRAGGMVMTGVLDVAGGAASNPGRVRVDASEAAGIPMSAYRGPMFVNLPEVVASERPTLEVVGGANNQLQYYISHAGNNEGPYPLTLGTNGRKMFEPQVPLKKGRSTICLLVPGADTNSPTKNCASLAHIFKE